MHSALDLRNMLRRGEVSAVELTTQALDRIDARVNLGAFISVRPEVALEAATAADRLIAETPREQRHSLPPLLGVPTAHKDLVQVRGFVTTHGSAAVPHTVAAANDPIAQLTENAGAICVGKTQVPEFGIAGYSENLVAAPARNPFDTSRTAGGSSGGTAVAVATGMVPAAIGSDAGGSVRIPSAACGLVGLKPGRGAVPVDTLQGLTDHLGAPRMSVSGPMARNALDAALLYNVLTEAAHEPALAALSRSREQRGLQGLQGLQSLRGLQELQTLRGLRIGVNLSSPFASRMPIHFDDDAHAALERAARSLEQHGHHVEEAAFDYGETYPDAFTTVWTQALTRISFTAEAEGRLGELAAWFLSRARAANPQQVAESVAAINRFAVETAEQWGRYNIVLTPALAHAAPTIGEFWAQGAEGDYQLQCEWAPQTSMVNVVGVPAITVPAGLEAAGGLDTVGLPRGVQLIGRAGSEVQLLQLADQLLRE